MPWAISWPSTSRVSGPSVAGLAPGLVAPVERDARPDRVRLRPLRLRPGDQHRVGLSVRDPLGHQVDQQLRGVAADRAVQLGPRRRLQASGEAARQVGVGAKRRCEGCARIGEQPDDGDGVERDRVAAGIGKRRGGGVRHQVERRSRRLGRRGAVARLADADEDGRARVNRGHAMRPGTVGCELDRPPSTAIAWPLM